LPFELGGLALEPCGLVLQLLELGHGIEVRGRGIIRPLLGGGNLGRRSPGCLVVGVRPRPRPDEWKDHHGRDQYCDCRAAAQHGRATYYTLQ
jgi:hypothetical protein